MTNSYVLMTILACGFALWLLKVVPLILAKAFRFPRPLVQFLSFVPIAIFAAIIAENIFVYHQGAWPGINWESLLASVPAVIAAIVSKSLLAVVIVGVVAMALIRLLGWG